RADPQGELARLVNQLNPITSPAPEVTAQLQFWLVDGNVLAQQWQSLVAAPPLAWNEQLWTAAAGHSQEMIRQRNQQHQLPGEPNPGVRMANAGYPVRSWGESVAARCTTVVQCHAAFAIDWGPGPSGQPQAPGIQSPPAHRHLLMSTRYREIGIAVVPHTPVDASDVGPLVVTKDFAIRDNLGNSFVVGAVFQDANNSSWYENGEGRGGARIRFEGPAGTFETTSMTAGGFQLQLPPGTYQGSASGGGLREPLHAADVVVGSGNNVWLNFREQATALPGDRFEPNNDLATATPLGPGDSQLANLSVHLPDNFDYYRWTAPADGTLTARINFVHAAGNLELKLYNSAQTEVASSNGAGDTEQVTWTVTAGSDWYLRVGGAQRAVNGSYTLDVNGPGGESPVAVDDKTATDRDVPVVIAILANDTDADGDLNPASVQITQQPLHGRIAINTTTGSVTYTPTTGYLGSDRFRYTVRDATNFATGEANVVLAVVDYQGSPWQNPGEPTDADASGSVVPQDALVIINRLNAHGSGPLNRQPSGAVSPPAYVDTSGDNFLSPNDVLRVINFLNRAVGGGEADGAFETGASLAVPALVGVPGTQVDPPSGTDDGPSGAAAPEPLAVSEALLALLTNAWRRLAPAAVEPVSSVGHVRRVALRGDEPAADEDLVSP
ncbi:MAG: Ig-like domain-containing protein, partial [Pirellulaceae bacterium]